MKKLAKVFRMNPLYEADGYKIGHHLMLAPNTNREYFTWIPRNLKYMHPSITKLISAGQQLSIRWIHSSFQEFFFDKSVDVAVKFGKDMAKYLDMEYNYDHFVELHKLGYLPIVVQSLPEGIFTKANIPHLTGMTTKDGFAWLGLFLETFFSKTLWQMPTAATIASKFKDNAVEWTKKTNSEGIEFTNFMCHDFHSRGGNPFTSIAVSLGHALSNLGTDTLAAIPSSRYFYDVGEDEVAVASVNASEHSVTCTGIFYYDNKLRSGELDHEIEKYYSFDVDCEGSVESPDYLAIAEYLNLRDWLKKFPTGILSVVSDTFDLWKLIMYVLPRLKEEILQREGTLVIRPDSGDPVDIICGKNTGILSGMYKGVELGNTPESKGVIELLWDIFGGTVSKEGYKVLNPKIGAIYGDSINLERQVAIYERLAKKEFAATNVILGVGSYTYVMLTRDSAGFAAKGAWFEVLENGKKQGFNIFKDPITDDGTKKSLKGFQFVTYDFEQDEYVNESEVTEEKAYSKENLLTRIYEDGQFYNQTTLGEIRERVSNK